MNINAFAGSVTFQLYLGFEFYYLLSSYVLNFLFSPQLDKKYPGFSGNQNFITAFTSACHLSLF